MRDDLTNLLPSERVKALLLDYLMRLAVVLAVLVILLTLSSIALQIPTYIFLTENAEMKKAYLTNLESTPPSTDTVALSARLASLNNNMATLIAFARPPSVSSTIRSLLAVAHPGIALSNFSYSSSKDAEKDTLTVSGTAATRDALRNYQLALQNAPFVLSANLPVSAYAKDINIVFTITITLAP